MTIMKLCIPKQASTTLYYLTSAYHAVATWYTS